MVIRKATPSDSPAIARVSVDTWRDAYAGLMPAELLATLTYEDRERRWRDRLLANPAVFAYVAAEAEDIVGFAVGGPERDGEAEYDGELYALYVLPARQRSGAGRRLMCAVIDRLRRQDRRSLIGWVLAPNPSRRFYKKMGGCYLRDRQITLRDGHTALTEAGYGWPDLQALSDVLSKNPTGFIPRGGCNGS